MKRGVTLIEVLAILIVLLLLGIFLVLLFRNPAPADPRHQSAVAPQPPIETQPKQAIAVPREDQASASRVGSPLSSDKRRAICASNLKGIATGFYTYANENRDMWPIAAHALATDPQEGRVTYAPGKTGVLRGDGKSPESGQSSNSSTELSTTRNLWTLVRTMISSPKSFVCPESGDTPNGEDHGWDMWDFRNLHEVSYGYQVPYGKLGQPSSSCDLRMPLSADKGAISAALELGSSPPSLLSNSPNHNGEGQNVLFADGHVEFVTTPAVGVGKDNIYTQWSDAMAGDIQNQDARSQGKAPTGRETPWSNTDTLIYP